MASKLVFPKNEHDVELLAERLTNMDRDEPIIVVACHARPEAREAAAVREAVGCDVYFLCDARRADELSRAMPKGCSTYAARGKATLRVYPAGIEWINNPRLSQFRITEADELASRSTLSFLSEEVEATREAVYLQLQLPSPLSADIDVDILRALATPGERPVPPARIEHENSGGDGTAATQRVLELERLRAELETLRDSRSRVHEALESAKDKIRALESIVAGCRCAVIEGHGSPGEAIRAAESRARDAETKVEWANERSERLSAAKPLVKWIETMGLQEEAFVRLLIERQWRESFDPDARERYPMSPYEFGADFFQTVAKRRDLPRLKLIRVLVEIASRRATSEQTVKGHRFRTGSGGGDPYLQEERRGSRMRFNLENNTPAAPRVNVWLKSGEPILFESVTTHDDFNIYSH